MYQHSPEGRKEGDVSCLQEVVGGGCRVGTRQSAAELVISENWAGAGQNL